MVLVVDELDHLVINNNRNHHDIIVNLLKWASASSSSSSSARQVQAPPLILVSIANSLELPEGVTKKLDAQGIPSPEKITFSPYDASTLNKIVVGRVGPQLIDERALKLLSKRTEVHGDVRAALDLVKAAVKEAIDEVKGKQKKQTRGSSRATALSAASPDDDDAEDGDGGGELSLPLVKLAHIANDASALLRGKGVASVTGAIKELPLHAKTLLVAAVKKANKSGDASATGGIVTFKDLETIFLKLQKKLSVSGDGPHINIPLGQLEETGLMKRHETSSRHVRGDTLAMLSSRKKGEEKKEYQVNVCVDDVRGAIKDSEPRLYGLMMK